jgi:peptidase S51-like protein
VTVELTLDRPPGPGWLVLIGGGEFSFGETEDADRAWLAKAGPGLIGFLPTASGSDDYGRHFGTYLSLVHGRAAETIPVYRRRDALRGRNAERIAQMDAVYLGAGVTDHLLDALPGTPALDALMAKLASGVVVAIAAAAQALGHAARSLLGREEVMGLGLLPGTAVEPNFEPMHDRRLRQLMQAPGVRRALGIPAGSALLVGPGGNVEVEGSIFVLEDRDGDLVVLDR